MKGDIVRPEEIEMKKLFSLHFLLLDFIDSKTHSTVKYCRVTPV